jgi:sugar phosphate isomerase/epimerase
MRSRPRSSLVPCHLSPESSCQAALVIWQPAPPLVRARVAEVGEIGDSACQHGYLPLSNGQAYAVRRCKLSTTSARSETRARSKIDGCVLRPGRMTRRAFLVHTAMLSTVAMTTSVLDSVLSAQARAATDSGSYQLGCYTRPFDKFDYRAAMDAIVEAGFKYLGLMTTNTKEWDMIRPSTTPEEVRTISAEAKQRGLKIVSIFGDFSVAASIEEGIGELKRLIEHTELCGCPSLMFGGTTDEKLYQAYYKVVAECCGYAAGKGIGLSVKPHGGQNATGPQCRKAIEMVQRKNFGLWYDPGNILYYSDGKLDPVEDAAMVNGLVVGMSVKDFRPPKDVHVNPGAGKVDFGAVLARLKRGGFIRGPLVLECLQRGPLDSVKAAAKKARQFMEELTGQKA